MKHGNKLAESLSTLMFSWGSEPPSEVYWALTEMIEFINLETGSTLEPLIGEEYDKINDGLLTKIIDHLKSPICNEVN